MSAERRANLEKRASAQLCKLLIGSGSGENFPDPDSEPQPWCNSIIYGRLYNFLKISYMSILLENQIFARKLEKSNVTVKKGYEIKYNLVQRVLAIK